MSPAWLPYSLFSLGSELLNRLVPDPVEKQKLQQQLVQLEQQGSLRAMEQEFSILRTEAASKDKWVSRARPVFLYVMYLMIIAAIPMGVLHAVWPDTSHNVIKGVQAWLSAIPEPLWVLFGTGYLGYTGARSWDKRKT